MLSFLLRKIAIPRQLLTFLPRKEAILSQQLLSFLPAKEAVSPQQLLTFLPRKEATLSQQLLTFLPGKEAIHLQQAVPPRQLLSFLPVKAAILPLLSLPLGKETVPPKQVNLIIRIGQEGKASGVLTGTGQPRLPRRPAPSPGKTTPILPHLLGPPRIF